MVDASLTSLAQGEFVTISTLPNNAEWEVFEAARQALFPNLSRDKVANRYHVALALQKRGMNKANATLLFNQSRAADRGGR
jgi:hypothetical protein